MQHVNQQGPSRRTMLRAGAAAGTAAALGTAGLFAAGTARAAATAIGNQALPYPSGVTDTSHCTPGVSSLFPNTITSTYPADFKDSEQNADPVVVQAARALQAAFGAGDAAAAVALMSADVVHEDMAAHTRVRGQLQAQRYYTRALGQLPYGPGAALVHAGGSRQGGGYEWSAAPVAAPMRRGHTAIELDEAGKISRLTAIYDSCLLNYTAYQSLAGLAAEAPLSIT